MATRRYVRPNPSGGWDVLKEGHRRSVVHADTQARAVSRARDLVRSEGGGEIRVLNHMGKITEADTIDRREKDGKIR